MGIGREVADAYIDVHGDLSSFRRDLQGADSDMRAAAFEAADTFADAWGKRVESDVNGKWASIVGAMYSEKQIDWDRMIGEFDSSNLDEARKQITGFLREMRETTDWGKDEEGGLIDLGPKLDPAQFDTMIGRLHEVVAGMQKQEDKQNRLLELQRELSEMQDRQDRVLRVRREAEEEAHRDNERWMERRAKTMAEAIEMNKAWARTWEGMRKNNAISNMEADFKKLAGAMNFVDMGKFAKSFDSLTDARQRIFDVTTAMLEQKRISQERADELHAQFNAFMDDEAAKSKAMKDALDDTNRLQKAQDEYNKSLSGMARNSHFKDLEAQFQRLAVAMDSNDWSQFAKGSKNAKEMEDSISGAATEMHRLGRMTDQELTLVNTRAKEASASFKELSGELDRQNAIMERTSSSGGGGGKFRKLLGEMGDATRGLREHLQGFAGLNVFGDMISAGLDFVHNLDRIAVSLGKSTLLMGTMASVGASALAGLVTIAADLGDTLGGLAVLAPSYFVGLGIGVGVLTAALQDTKKVLGDLKPAFEKLQDTISASFWAEAAGPIREAVNALMPLISAKTSDTAKALGGLVGKLAKAFGDIPAEDIGDMFDRMNRAIDILGDAMAPLVRAFTNLGKAGSKTFERFSTWLVKLSNQFDAFIQTASDNGDLDRWIDNAIEGMKDIGRAIDGTIGIFNAINTAAERAGFGGLSTFADALQRAAAIMQTPEFQNTLTVYFEAALKFATKLGEAIVGLGPAFDSFAPTAVVALGQVGDAVAKIIAYVGQIFTNPTFQEGVANFTVGLNDAITKLEPAIKPFADSLGNALTLLGQIVVSVAEVAAAFTVTLGPVLDSMSAKLGTLIQPLKDTALNFIKELEGPLKAIDEQFIGPLVTAFNEKLLPAINGFIDEFGPFATKVIEEIGPSFKVLVDDVLPNLVRLATEILDPLGKFIAFFTPTLATVIQSIGTALGNMADGVKVLKGELPVTELKIFEPITEEKLKAQIEVDSIKPARWRDIFEIIMTKNIGEGVGLAWTEKVWPAIVKADDWLWEQITHGFDLLMGGHTTDAEKDRQKKNREMVAAMFGIGDADAFDREVNKWFEDNVFKPLRDLGADIGKIWDDTLGSFFNDVFGGGNEKGSTGGGMGSSGAGGRGRGVTGKLDPSILTGTTPEQAEQDWQAWANDIISRISDIPNDIWQGFINGFSNIAGGLISDITKNFTDWVQSVKDFFGIASPSTLMFDMASNIVQGFINGFIGLGEKVGEAWGTIVEWITLKVEEIKTNVALFVEDFKAKWGEFWGGIGQKVQEAWDAVVLWITTKVTEIQTNIALFIEQVKTNWNTFWTDLGTTVSTKWEEFKTFISTKITEIQTNIAKFVEDVKTNWNNFWEAVRQKVEEIWNTVTTWIATKVTEIKTNVDKFITDVRTNWDNFWNGVKQKVTDIWNQVTGWISSKVGEIRGNIERFITQVRTNWDTFWGNLPSAVQTGINDVITWVSGIPSRIVAALGSLGSTLWSQGWSIIDGFLRGLKSSWAGVTDFVGGIASWIAANKGPLSYDRTLLEPAGRAIMTGLQNGLESKMDPLLNTLQAITGMVTDTVTGDLSKSVMYVAGKDAAQGLAEGLKANRSAVHTALGNLGAFTVPSSQVNVAGSFAAVGRPTADVIPGNALTIAEGAIKIETPTKDPELVAAKVIDSFVNYSTF